MTRFPNTHCSQCGQEFGPGDHGYSHCSSHRKRVAVGSTVTVQLVGRVAAKFTAADETNHDQPVAMVAVEVMGMVYVVREADLEGWQDD